MIKAKNILELDYPGHSFKTETFKGKKKKAEFLLKTKMGFSIGSPKNYA